MKSIYTVIWGRADKRLALKQQERLATEIQEQLFFLFKDYGARIVPNIGIRFPPPFDYAVVTLEVGELLFRFVRGRGEIDVQVKSKSAAKEWHDISLVIGALDNPDEMQHRTFVGLVDVAAVLKQNMSRINDAFCGPKYLELQQRLADFNKFARVVTKQLETEINRRLYS